MKTRFRNLMIAAVVAIFSISSTAHAQSITRQSVNIPFDFDCAGTHFKAGSYSFFKPQPYMPVISIVGAHDTIMTQTVIDSQARTSGVSRFTFMKQGSSYTLIRATMVESSTTISFPLSRKQQRAERERTQASLNKEIIELPVSNSSSSPRFTAGK